MSRAADQLRRWVRAPYLRQALLTSVAVGGAYAVAKAVPHVSAGTAAIAALIAIRPTFHGSLQETLRQLAGVVVGAGVAFGALATVGFSPWAVMVTILSCFAVARLLRLGADAGPTIAVTAILVVGPAMKVAYVETRLLGVAVGSLLGIAVSLFTRPGQPHERVLERSVRASDQVSDLLAQIAETLQRQGGRVEALQAMRWLDRAVAISRDLEQVRVDALDAVKGAAWSPLYGRRDAQAVAAQVELTQATVVTVVNMCRDLLAASSSRRMLPADVADALSDVFQATADVISEQSEGAREAPAEPLSGSDEQMTAAKESRRHAFAHLRELDDTAPLLLGGSLLRDNEKIAEILSGH